MEYSPENMLSYSTAQNIPPTLPTSADVFQLAVGPLLNRILCQTNAIHTLKSNSPEPIPVLSSKR
jgi:hypothetical protein